MQMPVIETMRLLIRPFTPDDVAVAHRIIDRCFHDGRHADDAAAIEAYRPFVQWMSLNHQALAELHQPAYGDRALALRSTGEVIGQVGFVPCLNPFDQIPELNPGVQPSGFNTPEVGLFWAIDPDHQRQGYASEAGQALIDYAFSRNGWNLEHIIATTEYDNGASQAVMLKLGMTLARNLLPEPPWLQIVGILHNPRIAAVIGR